MRKTMAGILAGLVFGGAAGALGGMLLGAEQENVLTNEYSENVKQAVRTTMEQNVNADATASCSNIIEIGDSTCCTFKFGEQYCSAAAVNDVVVNGEFTAKVTQDLISSLTQSLNASNEGLALTPQNNDANNVTKRVIDLSTTIKQAFNTSCGKYATGVNQFSLQSAYCGQNADGTCQTKETPDFDIAGQTVSVEALGNCSATATASSEAAQYLGLFTDQTATASNVGVDLLALAFAAIAPFLGFLLIPIGYQIMTYKQTKKGDQAQKAGAAIFLICMFLIVLGAFVVWPGFFAQSIGADPWPRPADGGLLGKRPIYYEKCTIDGGLAKQFETANRWVWFDKECVNMSKDLKDANYPCTIQQQLQRYDTCGIWARANACKSSEWLNDRDSYIGILEACDNVQLLVAANKNCDSAGVGSLMLEDSYGIFCKLCSAENGADPQVAGLFAKLDPFKLANDEDCKLEGKDSISGVLPDKCYLPCTLDKIGQVAYFPTNLNNATGEPDVCSENDRALGCISTENDYKNRYPNECLDKRYMAHKKNYVQAIDACSNVNRYAIVKPTEEQPVVPLTQQCPPLIYDYLKKCDPFTQICDYTASDPTDSREVEACKNSFENCQEPGYVRDSRTDDQLRQDCEADFKDFKSAESFIDNLPMYAGLIYLALFVLGVSMRFIFGVVASDAEGAGNRFLDGGQKFLGGGSTCTLFQQSAFFFYRSRTGIIGCVLFGLVLFVAGVFGLVQTLLNDNNDNNGLAGSIAMTVIGFFALAICGILYYKGRDPSLKC